MQAGQAQHIRNQHDVVFNKSLFSVKEAVHLYNRQLERAFDISAEERIYLKPVTGGLQLKIPPTTVKKLNEIKWTYPTFS